MQTKKLKTLSIISLVIRTEPVRGSGSDLIYLYLRFPMFYAIIKAVSVNL